MKAVVVISGGLDSAVNLAWACREYNVVRAVTFDYGQRASLQEIAHARSLCEHYQVVHEAILLPSLASWTTTALVEKNAKIPQLSPTQLDNRVVTLASAKAVWVPNRNGVFFNMCAALAEGLEAKYLIAGFNVEEGETFPDNSAGFVDALNKSLYYSTMNHVEVVCKTLAMNKSEIVKLGLELEVPFKLIWSCYEGDEKMCGTCESCLRLKRAVQIESPQLLEVLNFAH